MNDALLHGSLLFIFAWLLVGGLGVPLPEDAALLATGVLVQQGAVHPALALPVVLAGVIGGDAMLFGIARRLGPSAYEHRLVQRVLPRERRARIEEAYERYGGWLVFFARHVAGLRGAVFAMAGIHGMRPARFLLWDTAAACLSVPLVVGLGYLGARHVDRVRAGIASASEYGLVAVAFGALGFMIWRHVRKLRGARRSRPPTG